MSADLTREARTHAREIKFLLPAALEGAVREWARAHLSADPHGQGPCGDEYDTATIYFDTAARDVFHGRGSFGRSKYRVRRYGRATSVHLERKLRRPALLTKRRTTIDLDALRHLVEGAPADWEGDWFLRRLRVRSLQPVCRIGYHRLARAAMTAAGLARLTLDNRLRAASASSADFEHDGATVAMLEGYSILELKFRRDVPALFKTLIAELQLEPRTLSKYRTAMAVLESSPDRPLNRESPVGPEATDARIVTDPSCA